MVLEKIVTREEKSSINEIKLPDTLIDEASIGPQISVCTKSMGCRANGEICETGSGAVWALLAIRDEHIWSDVFKLSSKLISCTTFFFTILEMAFELT